MACHNENVVLRPLDIVILLKVHLKEGQSWSQMGLASELGISSQSVNAGLKRAQLARLYDPYRKVIIRSLLLEAIIHGIRFFVPAVRGEASKGMPTAWAGPHLQTLLMPSNDPPPVWPTPLGEIEGYAFEPLHESVPHAAARDYELYELLTLVDAIREGDARSRRLAGEELRARITGVRLAA